MLSTADVEGLVLVPIEQGDEAAPSGHLRRGRLLAKLSKATHQAIRTSRPRASLARCPGAPSSGPLWSPRLIAPVSAPTHPPLPSDAAPASAGQTAAHLRVSGVARSSTEYDEIVVTLEIEKGFHINANPASFDFLIQRRLPWPECVRSMCAIRCPHRCTRPSRPTH
jgi:hypothetical protein